MNVIVTVTEDINGIHCVQIDGAMLTPHQAIQHAFDIVQHAATAAYANGQSNAPHSED